MLNLESAFARLLRGSVDHEDLIKMAAVSERQARNVASVVADLTDVAQLEHEIRALQPCPVELTGLVRDVVERERLRLERASCELSVDLAPPITGSWDPLRIEQVMQRLLANAAKFGAGKPIEVKVEALGESARVSVADHGIGIDPSDHERIFARFARGVAANHYGGLGSASTSAAGSSRLTEARSASRARRAPAPSSSWICRLDSQGRRRSARCAPGRVERRGTYQWVRTQTDYDYGIRCCGL